MINNEKFQKNKKSHWKSYEFREGKEKEELENNEFLDSPFNVFDKIKSVEFDRKSFLKLMGAGVAMTSLNCVRKPIEKIVPYVDLNKTDENSQYDYVRHGRSYYYASVCGNCAAGCGTLVKSRDGRPLKLEGNSEQVASQGALCASGQASIFDLYDPDRATDPYIIKNGNYEKLQWSKVDSEIINQINVNKGKTFIFSKPIFSKTAKSLVSEFLSKVGGGKFLEFDPTSSFEAISKAQELSYGKALVPDYRFEKANFVLSIDCDFMNSWVSPVEYQKSFSKNRELRSGEKAINQYVAVESIPTTTGSNADKRIAIKPGDARKFALTLAALLVKEGAKNYSNAVSSVNIEQSINELGINKDSIELLAKELWKNKGKSLIVGGGVSTQTKDSVDFQVSINLLNSMLENDGKTILSNSPKQEGKFDFSGNLKMLEKGLANGEVGVLILHDVNLLYNLPDAEKWKKLLRNAKLVVSLADRLDETTVGSSNYLAPISHFLESWGEVSFSNGVDSIQQPTIRPLFNTRSFEDSLIIWAGGEIDGKTRYYDYLRSSWESKLGGKKGWENLLRIGTTKTISGISYNDSSSRNFNSSSLKGIDTNNNKNLKLALFETVALKSGKHANNSLLQELPDPVTKITWDNYVLLSPVLAEEKGIKSNDVLNVKTSSGQLKLPAQIQPGMHKNGIGIPVGYGRTSSGSIGNLVGKNSYALGINNGVGLVYSGLEVLSLEKTGETYKLASTQHHHMISPGPGWKDRPIVQSTSIAEYNKNPKSGLAEVEIPKILKNGELVRSRGGNPDFEYKGYKWGMSIDLTKCTGCSACVIACQVENNIPVVGRDEVRVGREMHWIRIDRYYIGNPNDPESLEIAHQPVMCQHCDNAPCETVCPVAATVHGSEGTNDMIYNRCVGTRYCSNNCPYKVRRFNWLQHWNGIDWKLDRFVTSQASAPRHLALNPEVSPRVRGVMEKCTFCSSRIAEKKSLANKEGRKLKDGEVKTACQETCPSDAITFGDVNQKENLVSKHSSDDRSYQLLEYLNVSPAVKYMTRVKNPVGVEV